MDPATSLLLLSLAPGLAGPAPTPAAAPSAPLVQDEDTEMMALYMADCAEWLPDPKDAGLLRAMRLLPARVDELSREIPDFELPPQVLPLVMHALSAEKTWTLHLDEAGGMVPIRTQLNISGGDAAGARQFTDALLDLLRMVQAPLGQPGENGLVPLQVGAPVPIAMGPMGSDFVLAVGPPSDAPFPLGDTGLPPGVEPDVVMRADYGLMVEMMMGFLAMEDPEVADQVDQVLSLFGIDEMRLHAASGSDDRVSHSVMRMPGWAGAVRGKGLISEQTVTEATLKLVPRDAAFSSVFTLDLAELVDTVNEAVAIFSAQEGVDDPLGMLTQMTGVDLRADILAHLGSHMGMYVSDTTGGTNLTAMVMFLEVSNPEGLAPMFDRMTALIDGLGQAEAEGYVRTRRWTDGGTHFITLEFPGLPVPLQPTLALDGDLLFVGATPTATAGALWQRHHAETSLLDHPGFRAQFDGNLTGAVEVDFLDSERLVREGYWLLSLGTSALANAVRSPHDPERDPGMILPPLPLLAKDAQATVTVVRVVGDDVVMHSKTDRSMLVQLGALAGLLDSTGLLSLLPVAAMAGMVGESQTIYYDEAFEAEAWDELEEEPILEDFEISDHEETDVEHTEHEHGDHGDGSHGDGGRR